MGKKIIQFVLGLVVLGLIYWVYVLISTPIKFEHKLNNFFSHFDILLLSLSSKKFTIDTL